MITFTFLLIIFLTWISFSVQDVYLWLTVGCFTLRYSYFYSSKRSAYFLHHWSFAVTCLHFDLQSLNQIKHTTALVSCAKKTLYKVLIIIWTKPREQVKNRYNFKKQMKSRKQYVTIHRWLWHNIKFLAEMIVSKLQYFLVLNIFQRSRKDVWGNKLKTVLKFKLDSGFKYVFRGWKALL